MLGILKAIVAIYLLYGIGKDLLKAIFTPNKFNREHKKLDNEDDCHIDYY